MTTAVSGLSTRNIDNPKKRFFPVAAMNRLQECTRLNQWLPNLEIATLVLIGGYLVRVMTEKLNCQGCIQVIKNPKGNAPVDGLIAYQDKGGLKYPTKELISHFISLSKVVDIVLDYRKQMERPLETSVEHAVIVLTDIPTLMCQNEDRAHRQKFLELLRRQFIRPLPSNHAMNITVVSIHSIC